MSEIPGKESGRFIRLAQYLIVSLILFNALVDSETSIRRLAELFGLEKSAGIDTEKSAVPNGQSTQADIDFTALVEYVQPSFSDIKSYDAEWEGYDPVRVDFGFINPRMCVSQQKHKVTFEYMTIDRDMSTDAVLAEMDRRGLRPARFEELRAFVKKNPSTADGHWIVALGTTASVTGRRPDAQLQAFYDAFVKGHGNLFWSGGPHIWYNHTVFLVVRK